MNDYRRDGFPQGSSPAFADMAGDIIASFEFFPPKSENAATQWWGAVEKLAPYAPNFVSVTYGAGGTTREGTLDAVRRLIGEAQLPVAAHLTCAAASRGEVAEVAEELWDAGVRHIVALRGDGGPPGSAFVPHPDGHSCAAELIEALVKLHPFEISVAAYPDVHPDATCAQGDMDNLKRKIDAGGTRGLTQFFFDPATFLRFRDRAVAAGIDAPMVPGILPITNFAQTRKFADACGAQLPGWIAGLFSGLEDDADTRQLVGATLAADMCRQLYAEGVREFHFYTLNRAETTQAVCQLLGKRAVRPAAAQVEQAA